MKSIISYTETIGNQFFVFLKRTQDIVNEQAERLTQDPLLEDNLTRHLIFE